MDRHQVRKTCCWKALLLLCAPATLLGGETEFWAFQTLTREAPPAVRHADRVRTPIDAFVLARLEEKGLTYSHQADRLTLMRRAYFDLIGLPPSPAEVDAYLADDHTASDGTSAYERLVDRLLASPRFGERWGRHWIDAVGYVDTTGFDVDENNIIMAEGKWLYRHYVIQSFNQDKPYDRFVTEQLAGDEIVDWRNAQKYTPEIRELLIATGYLRTSQDFTHEPESNIPLIHYMVLHDTVEIVAKSLLGLSLNCARCHSHKFDPIPQEDYYRFQAAFTPAYNPQNWKPVYPYNAKLGDRALPDVSTSEKAAIDRRNKEIDARVNELKEKIATLHAPYEERLFEAKLKDVPEAIRADTGEAIKTPANKRNAVQKFLADKFEKALKVEAKEVSAALTDPDKATEEKLNQDIAAANSKRRRYGKIQALYDVGPPPPTYLLRRGNHERPGETVEPGFLTALDGEQDESLIPKTDPTLPTSGRRAALAKWLTRRHTPAAALLSRVMVNRIWQHVFGAGIVTTPANFGKLGQRPTHPKLLEWLAGEFVQSGWSVKSMIKLMMLSEVYRQTSRPQEPAFAVAATPTSGDSSAGTTPESADPENHYLWRMRLRRLESELIRDSILASSGNLNLTMGGRPVMLQAGADGMVVIAKGELESPDDQWKRSVYVLARRGFHLSLLNVFDQPSVTTVCSHRDASAVPLQSLTMLNDKFLFEQGERLAKRARSLAGQTDEERIEMAFRLTLGRKPNVNEIAACRELLERQSRLYRSEGVSDEMAAERAFVHVCHTLFNTSEFLYAE